MKARPREGQDSLKIEPIYLLRNKPLQVNHPLQQVIVWVPGVKADRRQTSSGSGALTGTGAPNNIYAGGSQHFLAFLGGAFPDKANIGTTGHGCIAPEGRRVPLGVNINLRRFARPLHR